MLHASYIAKSRESTSVARADSDVLYTGVSAVRGLVGASFVVAVDHIDSAKTNRHRKRKGEGLTDPVSSRSFAPMQLYCRRPEGSQLGT